MNDEPQSEFVLSCLAQFPSHVHQISTWLFEEWGDDVEGRTIKQFSDVLNNRMNIDVLPMAFVAIASGEHIGTASLVCNEISSLGQYKYWLASVFVTPERRRQGWGTKIVRGAIQVAPDYGIDELFLYTRSHIDFYQQLGWEHLDTVQYRNRDAMIMRHRLHMA